MADERVFINVVSDEEAAQADYMVCARAGTPTPFTDNLTGECIDCGCGLIFRPYMPKSVKRICLQCAVARTEAERST